MDKSHSLEMVVFWDSRRVLLVMQVRVPKWVVLVIVFFPFLMEEYYYWMRLEVGIFHFHLIVVCVFETLVDA